MSIFANAIAKIDIRIKKLTALPERPIKVPFRGFRGLQKRVLNLFWSTPKICEICVISDSDKLNGRLAHYLPAIIFSISLSTVSIS
jgi:hypothetical protein